MTHQSTNPDPPQELEARGCTFNPSIIKTPPKLKIDRGGPGGQPAGERLMSVAEGGAFAPYSSSSGDRGGDGGGGGGGGSAIPPGVPAHEKLYRDFTRYKKKRERRRQDYSVERRRKCTFEPTLFTR